jgi:predicted aconitase with swiveling domain
MATGKKTGGRVKGTPNRITSSVKEMILTALDKKGGVNYLVQQADENPVAFMALVGKVLPLQVQTDPDAPFQIEIIKRVIVDPNGSA